MHISDAVLECSRRSLRLAAECTDERVAVELNLLAIRLLLAAVKDAALIIEQSPTFMSVRVVR
jgi:hypothetical protein